MRKLIEGLLLPALNPGAPGAGHDSAVLTLGGARVAFTTDGYVVHPRFFPGGDIGSLAVYGTVNDLAMAGAQPAYLSAGLVLEEGLPMEELARIVASMGAAAKACGVEFVTGDTKVVDRGKGDGVYIHTTGLGLVAPSLHIHPSQVRPGDAILLSGDMGRHGIAVLSVREGLAFDTPVLSDAAPVHGLVRLLIDEGLPLHCLRDPTRGGVATVLHELAHQGGVGMVVDEGALPVSDDVAGACELLGLDPLYVACEGRFVAILPDAYAIRAIDLLRSHPLGAGACRIGSVTSGPAGEVTLQTTFGGKRILPAFAGEQLPRIC